MPTPVPSIPMPTRDGRVELRPLTFTTLTEKASWIDAQASLDATDPKITDYADRFAKACGPNAPSCVATALHNVVRDGVRYVNGPGHQRMYDAATTLARGYGNCVDKSRLFVALCRAVEVDARIVPVFNNASEFYHCQAQVRWPGSALDRRAEPGGWLRAEMIIPGVALGNGAERVKYDRNGSPVLS
jgi:transglutaminase-like putative cysteine protease